MSLNICNPTDPPALLRHGEALYASPGLMVRRCGKQLWVRTDALTDLLWAYKQNPGCYPGGAALPFLVPAPALKEEAKR